ncbi:MAG: hypothetical protein HYZ91_05570 [Candidatus Omnitrophica bacterium]|nr:hypothetical protein [Candidatus Omnitrophota bacterium]
MPPLDISKLRHELKTPILAMQQALALLGDEVAGPLNEEQKRFVALSQRNLERLHGLIEELLRLSEPSP